MNLIYKTEEIFNYFSKNRIKWDDFYESEKIIIEKIWDNNKNTILDVGCGCGGLSLALNEKFGSHDYTGVEINDKAASYANEILSNAKIINADFDNFVFNNKNLFDKVFSLSCIDWNNNFESMFEKAWNLVKPGGFFIFSIRLDLLISINDINISYQYINYSGLNQGEIANYVIVSIDDISNIINKISPLKVYGYGYFGPTSATAKTPFKQLCFGVFALQKRTDENNNQIITDLSFPKNILDKLIKNLNH